MISGIFPANGRFSEDQKLVYNIVLAAHNNAAAQLAPGAVWPNITQTAFTTLAQGLLDVTYFTSLRLFLFFLFSSSHLYSLVSMNH
jgi:Xaa-Pro aminopeptidase